MVIDDPEEADRWLTAVNYYRLSGYSYSFREQIGSGEERKRADSFKPGTTLTEVCALYEFDRKLRTLLLDGLERVEVAIRSAVSLVLGAKDPCAHEIKDYFRPTFDHQGWIKTARSRVSRAAPHSEFINHHLNHRDGKIPIWVLVDVLDFSDVSKLYEGMVASEQFQVAELVGFKINWDRLSKNQRKRLARTTRYQDGCTA